MQYVLLLSAVYSLSMLKREFKESPKGKFEFGGWAGRAEAVPHMVTVSASGFAQAKQPLQLKGMERVHATVKLAPKMPPGA